MQVTCLLAVAVQWLSIPANRDVIAIDEDSLGKQGDRFAAEGSLELWTRSLAHRDKSVAVFNRSTAPLSMSIDLKALGYAGYAHLHDLSGKKILGYSKVVAVL
jgi:alpha-galactosidase